jgi:hypothetical protein
MKRTKLVQKNLELSFEFTRYLLAHPEMEEKIPKGAQVVLLPDYDERLRRFNLKKLSSTEKMDSRWYTCGSKS